MKHLVQLSAIGADPASPSAYGRSKAAGEAAVRAAEHVEGVQGLLSQSVVIPAPNMDLVRRSIY